MQVSWLRSGSSVEVVSVGELVFSSDSRLHVSSLTRCMKKTKTRVLSGSFKSQFPTFLFAADIKICYVNIVCGAALAASFTFILDLKRAESGRSDFRLNLENKIVFHVLQHFFE